MAVADSVNILNKKMEDIVNKSSLDIYERVTWLHIEQIRNEVVKWIKKQEEEAKKNKVPFSKDYLSDKYIEQQTSAMFNKAVGDNLRRQWLSVDFEETIKDGKEVLVFTVRKIERTFEIPLDFTYEFNVWEVKAIERVETK